MTVKDIARTIHVLGPTQVVCHRAIQELCAKPYPGHPKGCPNTAHCSVRPFFLDRYSAMVHVVALEFNFGDYLAMMAKKHPDWSDRKLRCPLYWQGHLRKELRDYVAKHPVKGHRAFWIPEASGVNVTETCKNVGLELQWPPMDKSYMVVLYVKHRSFEDDVSGPPRRSAILREGSLD